MDLKTSIVVLLIKCHVTGNQNLRCSMHS